MRNVVQVGFPLPKERETGMVGGKGIRLIVATGFFGHQLPEVQILLGPSHRVGVSASGVRQSEQIQQPIVDQPRQPNDFVRRLVPFEQECRSSVITNQAGNLLTSRQVASQITQDRTGDVFSFDGVLRGANSTRFGVNLRRQRLGDIVEQSRKDQDGLLVRV